MTNRSIQPAVRFILSLVTGYLGYMGYEEMTVGALLAAGILWGINLALKRMDGTKYGPIIALVVGPKVQDLTKSLVRSLVTVIAGATYGYLQLNAAELEHATLVEVVTLAVAAIFSYKFRGNSDGIDRE